MHPGVSGSQQQRFLLGPVTVVINLPVDVDIHLVLDFFHDAFMQEIGRQVSVHLTVAIL